MTIDLFAIVLLIIGLAILVAEIFLPSAGALTIAGLACLAGSIYCAHDAWWEVDPGNFWTFMGALIFLVPFVISAAFFFLPRTSWGRRILLTAPTTEEVTPYQKETAHLQQFVGKRGRALTLMTPGGLVMVGDERHHAETRGGMVDPGTPIEVLAVRGTRLLVRQVDNAPTDLTAENDSLADGPITDDFPITEHSDSAGPNLNTPETTHGGRETADDGESELPPSDEPSEEPGFELLPPEPIAESLPETTEPVEPPSDQGTPVEDVFDPFLPPDPKPAPIEPEEEVDSDQEGNPRLDFDIPPK